MKILKFFKIFDTRARLLVVFLVATSAMAPLNAAKALREQQQKNIEEFVTKREAELSKEHAQILWDAVVGGKQKHVDAALNIMKEHEEKQPIMPTSPRASVQPGSQPPLSPRSSTSTETLSRSSTSSPRASTLVKQEEKKAEQSSSIEDVTKSAEQKINDFKKEEMFKLSDDEYVEFLNLDAVNQAKFIDRHYAEQSQEKASTSEQPISPKTSTQPSSQQPLTQGLSTSVKQMPQSQGKPARTVVKTAWMLSPDEKAQQQAEKNKSTNITAQKPLSADETAAAAKEKSVTKLEEQPQRQATTSSQASVEPKVDYGRALNLEEQKKLDDFLVSKEFDSLDVKRAAEYSAMRPEERLAFIENLGKEETRPSTSTGSSSSSLRSSTLVTQEEEKKKDMVDAFDREHGHLVSDDEYNRIKELALNKDVKLADLESSIKSLVDAKTTKKPAWMTVTGDEKAKQKSAIAQQKTESALKKMEKEMDTNAAALAREKEASANAAEEKRLAEELKAKEAEYTKMHEEVIAEQKAGKESAANVAAEKRLEEELKAKEIEYAKIQAPGEREVLAQDVTDKATKALALKDDTSDAGKKARDDLEAAKGKLAAFDLAALEKAHMTDEEKQAKFSASREAITKSQEEQKAALKKDKSGFFTKEDGSLKKGKTAGAVGVGVLGVGALAGLGAGLGVGLSGSSGGAGGSGTGGTGAAGQGTGGLGTGGLGQPSPTDVSAMPRQSSGTVVPNAPGAAKNEFTTGVFQFAK